MFKKGKKSLTLYYSFHNFILLLFLNSHLFPSLSTQMTTLQTFCTGVISEASLKQVSIRLRDVDLCLLLCLRPLESKPQTSWGSSLCLSLMVFKILAALMALYFHFHNTFPFGSTTSLRELHLFGLSLVMGNCIGVLKQMSLSEEQLDVTLTPLPTLITFEVVLTLTVAFSACSHIALILACYEVSGIKLLDTVYGVSKCISVHHSSVLFQKLHFCRLSCFGLLLHGARFTLCISYSHWSLAMAVSPSPLSCQCEEMGKGKGSS